MDDSIGRICTVRPIFLNHFRMVATTEIMLNNGAWEWRDGKALAFTSYMRGRRDFPSLLTLRDRTTFCVNQLLDVLSALPFFNLSLSPQCATFLTELLHMHQLPWPAPLRRPRPTRVVMIPPERWVMRVSDIEPAGRFTLNYIHEVRHRKECLHILCLCGADGTSRPFLR